MYVLVGTCTISKHQHATRKNKSEAFFHRLGGILRQSNFNVGDDPNSIRNLALCRRDKHPYHLASASFFFPNRQVVICGGQTQDDTLLVIGVVAVLNYFLITRTTASSLAAHIEDITTNST